MVEIAARYLEWGNSSFRTDAQGNHSSVSNLLVDQLMDPWIAKNLISVTYRL